jgi:preprotein translocase subunit SecG
MYFLLLIVAIIVCLLLGIIVLVQNPKGGGLSSNFASSSQLMGVQRTGDFLEKGTWILAIALMVISLTMNVVSKSAAPVNDKAQINKTIDNASKPSGNGATQTAPAFPTGPAPTTPAPNKQ